VYSLLTSNKNNKSMKMGLEEMNALKISYNVTLIICINGSSIINTRSNITSISYFCKTIFKDYYVKYKYF